MNDFTILAMADDVRWLDQWHADFEACGGTRVIFTTSLDEASDLLDSTGARLILVNWAEDQANLEQMARLLWVNSTLANPALVLVVADDYKNDQALTLFQLGVDDYLSIEDHADQLGAVLRQLLTERARRLPNAAPGTAA